MTAFLFAALFLAMLVITQLAVTYLGKGGVDTLAAIMGVSRCGPVHHGADAGGRALTPMKEAAGAILIAAASNNAVKGIYAYSLADKKTGLQALLFLLGLAAAGLAPLVFGSRHSWGNLGPPPPAKVSNSSIERTLLGGVPPNSPRHWGYTQNLVNAGVSG